MTAMKIQELADLLGISVQQAKSFRRQLIGERVLDECLYLYKRRPSFADFVGEDLAALMKLAIEEDL